MTITLTVADRIATISTDEKIVAGNTYPVTLSLDSEWTGTYYLRIRFGSLYYDIPASGSSVNVQIPVGYPEVGLGIYSENIGICTNEVRAKVLRSILEQGVSVVEFDTDLYTQWQNEVSELVCDSDFDAESTRPVQNAVLTAWKNTVPLDSALVHKTGNETIAGIKTFSSGIKSAGGDYNRIFAGSTVAYGSGNAKSYFVMSAPGPDSADINYGNIGLYQSYTGTGARNSVVIQCKNLDGSTTVKAELHNRSDGTTRVLVPSHLPVDGNGNHLSPDGQECINSAMLAVDPRIVHTSGVETIAGAKTFTSLLTAGNMAVEDASTPTVTMLKGSTEVANLASDGTQAGLTASSQFFGLRGLGTAPFGQAPSYTADNSADGKIVTRAMLAQTPTVVHTTGSETIAGTKTFSGMLATTKDLGWCRTYTHALGPGSWAKVYEVKRVASSGGMADIFNDFALDTWRGIEMHWGIGAGSGGYRMSGAIYGNVTTMVGRLVAVMARRASDNVAEIWIGNAQASGNINLVIDCKHVRIEAPIPSEATGDKPVVGSTYSEVVNMNVY